MSAVRCDLVVPVYNALRSTRDCLASVERFAPPWARVIVVNDGSDAHTTAWLRAREGILLLENPVNLGFVKTANRGLRFSDAPYVCLLNSDTLLTEGAVERVVARMDADPSIALCCPISNGAVNLSVKIPPGSDVFSFGRRVARTSPALYPDACTTVGFCLFVRREAIFTLGVFDEVFGRGYCEETDYHYRCRAAGWRCVVADDAFVYHRHEGSFTDRDARLARNMEILMARWRRLHEKELEAFNRKNELGAVRDDDYEWRLPDDAPEAGAVLFVLSSLRAAGAAAVLQLTDALLMRGKTANVLVLDESAPSDVELFFRPKRVAPERLREELARARTVVATDGATGAAVAMALDGQSVPSAGLLEAGPAPAEVRRLFGERAALLPSEGATLLPMSPEPDLFYPRVRSAAFRIAVREPLGLGVEEAAFGELPREKRAALFGSAHVVVETDPESAATALEAKAAGAVPILLRGSTAREVVADGEEALFVERHEVAAAVRRLASDPDLFERLAAAGGDAARARTWSAAAAAFSSWLETLKPCEALSSETRVALAEVVAARPRPAAWRPSRSASAPSPVRALLGRLRRRLSA